MHHQASDSPGLSNSIKPEDPCFYIYTSGTTGLPKAVIFNHGRFMKLIANFGLVAVRLQSTDKIYVPLPFFHATASSKDNANPTGLVKSVLVAMRMPLTKLGKDIKRFGSRRRNCPVDIRLV